MHTTKISRLFVIALILMAIGFALAQIVMGQSSRSLPVPAMAAGALWILGGGFGIWTYTAKPRLKREPGTKPFPPLASARIAVLALAATLGLRLPQWGILTPRPAGARPLMASWRRWGESCSSYLHCGWRACAWRETRAQRQTRDQSTVLP
jgi:hypothetical protein